MARTTGVKTNQPVKAETPAIAEVEPVEVSDAPPEPIDAPPEAIDAPPEPMDVVPEAVTPEELAPEELAPEAVTDIADGWAIDDCLNALKTLLSTVEKLQKVRQEVGDIKPLLIKMLDGEVSSGEDLDQLKNGVAGLSRLIRAYSDHQTALAKAQPARDLLDQVLKGTKAAD